MTPDDLRHVLHLAPAVFFVLRSELTRSQFDQLTRELDRAGSADSVATVEDHWKALQERMKGFRRWDKLTLRYTGPLDGGENMRRYVNSLHSVQNIITQRSYTAYTIDGVQYVVDVFNPANELELPYARAGEAVLALLLDNSIVRDRLDTVESFYAIVRRFDSILQPEYVRGTYSMAAVAFAYMENRIPVSTRPWELLFPLSVLSREHIPKALDLQSLFTRVESWAEERVLLQVMKGFDSALWPAYVRAARALNMTAVQEIVEGTYRQPSRTSVEPGGR
jgi:hypothetical protein